MALGLVRTFWDPGRRDWNYIGDGINGGQRVLSAIGKDADDVVFVSGQVRQRVLGGALGADAHTEPGRSVITHLQNRGRRLDKHGYPWRVYQLNHSSLVPVVAT